MTERHNGSGRMFHHGRTEGVSPSRWLFLERNKTSAAKIFLSSVKSLAPAFVR